MNVISIGTTCCNERVGGIPVECLVKERAIKTEIEIDAERMPAAAGAGPSARA